jgi:hypothetical protein
MKTVYRATNTTDAHVVSGLLEQAGVQAVVLDENMGPYGNALGSVRVSVAPESEADARAVIARWEAQRTRDEPAPPVRRLSRDAIVLLVGVVALLAVVWYFGGR